MDNILNKDYAPFMEDTLQKMVTLPVSSICIVIKLSDGAIMTNCFNSKMADKLMFSGILQQEAMLDVLKANHYIKDDDDDT